MLWRTTTKRVVITVLVCLAASAGAVKLINQRRSARTETEQYSIYSAYLFDTPVLEKPLPVECSEDPRFTRGKGVADIRQYFVSDVTESAFSWPTVLWHVPQERRAARWVPISVFSSFIMRNVSAEPLFANRFRNVEGLTPAMVKDARDVHPTEQPTLSASFTKVGFNRDFTMGMFYAEVSCGGRVGREYVIMHKVPSTGSRRYWYWYVVRVDRN